MGWDKKEPRFLYKIVPPIHVCRSSDLHIAIYKVLKDKRGWFSLELERTNSPSKWLYTIENTHNVQHWSKIGDEFFDSMEELASHYKTYFQKKIDALDDEKAQIKRSILRLDELFIDGGTEMVEVVDNEQQSKSE